jgi:hypothetical protein
VDAGCIMCHASGREAPGESSSGVRAWSRPNLDIIPAEGGRVCEVVRAPALAAVGRIRHLGEMKMKRSTSIVRLCETGDRHGRRSNEESSRHSLVQRKYARALHVSRHRYIRLGKQRGRNKETGVKRRHPSGKKGEREKRSIR